MTRTALLVMVALTLSLVIVVPAAVLASRPLRAAAHAGVPNNAAALRHSQPPLGALADGRPPQVIVVSFDGAGDPDLMRYWRGVAALSNAHFTFFLSGVYLLGASHRDAYQAPHHPRGASDIGFVDGTPQAAEEAQVRAMLDELRRARLAGNEVGTHYNGHFCDTAHWTTANWNQELDQFQLLLDATTTNGFTTPAPRPVLAADILGGRTPCLAGDMGQLYPALRSHGMRYDSSQTAAAGEWPVNDAGIWSFPLSPISVPGLQGKVLAMDYNFYINQTGARPAPESDEPRLESAMYTAYMNYLHDSLGGTRAPMSIGHHFTRWNNSAYLRALTRFVGDACGQPEVKCVSYAELAQWLDGLTPAQRDAFAAGAAVKTPPR